MILKNEESAAIAVMENYGSTSYGNNLLYIKWRGVKGVITGTVRILGKII